MGYPLKLRDGSMVILELKTGVGLPTEEEKEILRDYVQYLRDQRQTAGGKDGSTATALGKQKGRGRVQRISATKAKSTLFPKE